MARKKTNRCPSCGDAMRWAKRATTVKYGDESAQVAVSGWWCSCGEAILEGKDLLLREQAYKTLKARVDGVLAPAEVAQARSALGLSQREAGRLLGGGPRAFQKYESGEAAVSLPMSHLLRLLRDQPSLLSRVKKASAPEAKAERVLRTPRRSAR